MPPAFKPDIQRLLRKKKSYTKPQKREYIYGTITLYGSKIPNKIRFIPRGLKVCLYTTSP